MVTMMQAFQNLVEELNRVFKEGDEPGEYTGIAVSNPEDERLVINANDPALQKALKDAKMVFEKHSGENARNFIAELLARNHPPRRKT